MLTHKSQLLTKAALAFLCLSVLGGLLAAQSRSKQRGPRAIGVVEITPKGRARLVPIGILVDGKWYDAGIYMATPRPMALEPDTVYEAQKMGMPQGLFTVNAAQEVGGNWVGVGTWKPTTGEQAASPKKAESEKPQSANPEDDDAPPVLRRPGSTKPGAAPGATQPSASAPPAPADTAQQNTAKADTQREQAAAKPEEADDPNRPVLRRGKPAEQESDELDLGAGPSTKPSGKSSGTAQAQAMPMSVETLAAISDATSAEPRSFTLSLNPQERESNTRKMMELASQAIRKFAVTHPIRGKQAPSVSLADVQARDFDVNGSNDPILVLSARAPETPAPPPPAKTASAQRAKVPSADRTPAPAQAPPPPGAGFEYYVTVVARVDVNGEVRKLFDSVTDTSHLDAIPRLQLIDCVDADGDRVGELLFREAYDRSRAYIIYRVGMDKLWEVFQTSQLSLSR